jgi:hypothetical protein
MLRFRRPRCRGYARCGALRRVWSEASALELEHARIRKRAAHAAVEEARQPDGSVQMSLTHSASPNIELAGLTLSPSNVLHSLTVHEAVPLGAAEQLLSHALAGGTKPMARAALPGLCVSVAGIGEEALASEFGEEAAGAAMAVALGRPRPGHSVLGQGTFRAAAPAWAVLAERHALSTNGRKFGCTAGLACRSCGSRYSGTLARRGWLRVAALSPGSPPRGGAAEAADSSMSSPRRAAAGCRMRSA